MLILGSAGRSGFSLFSLSKRYMIVSAASEHGNVTPPSAFRCKCCWRIFFFCEQDCTSPSSLHQWTQGSYQLYAIKDRNSSPTPRPYLLFCTSFPKPVVGACLSASSTYGFLGFGRSITIGALTGRKLAVQVEALMNVVVPSVIMP